MDLHSENVDLRVPMEPASQLAQSHRDSGYVEEHSVLKYLTLADFEPTLETCWFGRVVLVCRFRVKTDMKDDTGRSVLMDCDCALIDCLYDNAQGGYNCIFVCQSTTLSKQCANLHQTMYKPLSYMFKHTPNCIKTLQTFYKLCANQQNCI